MATIHSPLWIHLELPGSGKIGRDDAILCEECKKPAGDAVYGRPSKISVPLRHYCKKCANKFEVIEFEELKERSGR